MDGSVIKSFLVSLGFNVDKTSEQKFNDGLAVATKKVTMFAAAVQAMAVGVFYSVMNTARSLNKLSDMSIRINVPVDKIEELGYIASQMDSSVEAVNSSLESLSSIVGQAAIGVGRGAMMFKKLGLEAKNSDGSVKNTSQVLEEIQKKIKNMSKPEQIAFLQRVGIDRTMVRMLTEDVSGLRDEYQKMYEVAGIDANEAAQAASDFMDEWGKLKTMSGMLYRAVNVGFMMKFKNDLIRLRKFMLENADNIKRGLQAVMTVIVRVAGVIGSVVTRVISWVAKLVNWYMNLDEKSKRLINTIGLLIAAWKLFNLQLLASPVGMLVAALTTLFLIVDDLLTYLDGGESAIDWSKWITEIESVMGWFSKLSESFSKGLEAISEMFDNLWQKFDPVDVFQSIIDWWNKLDSSAQILIEVIGAVVVAWKGLSLAFSFSPIGMTVLAIGGLITVLGDLFSFLNGEGNTLIDWEPWSEEINTVISGLKELWDVIVEVFQKVAPPIIELFTASLNLIGTVAGKILNAFKDIAPSLKGVFDGLISIVKSLLDVLTGIVDFITGVFEGDITKVISSLEKVFGGLFEFIKSGFKVVIGIIEGALALIGKVIDGILDLLGLSETDEQKDMRTKAQDARLREHFESGARKPNVRQGEVGDFGMTSAEYDAAKERWQASKQAGLQSVATQKQNDYADMQNYTNTPSPQTQAAMAHQTTNNRDITINNNTEVNVTEAQDAKATAKAVEDTQNKVNRYSENKVRAFNFSH